jgi:hypothetical protein
MQKLKTGFLLYVYIQDVALHCARDLFVTFHFGILWRVHKFLGAFAKYEE